MNNDNNFSFLNNDSNSNNQNNQNDRLNGSAETIDSVSTPETVSTDNIVPTSEHIETSESVQPTEPVQQTEQNVNDNVQLNNNFNNYQTYNETQTSDNQNVKEKKQLNPKFFILIGAIIALVIAGVFIFKKSGLGGENLNQNFNGKYNTYLKQVVVYGNSVFHKVRMYYDSSLFKENKSIGVNYYHFTDEKYSSDCQVLTILSSTSELDENSDAIITRTAYGNYKDFLDRHSDKVKSKKASKITTRKIGGLKYKYFKGSITYTNGDTKYFVSFEAPLNDKNYYSVNYEGSVDIDNKILKGFLNPKIEKYNSMEELNASVS